MNLMGELVLGRATALVQTVGTMNQSDEANTTHAEQLNQAAASLNYITTELQMAVMKMRMQPVGKVFSQISAPGARPDPRSPANRSNWSCRAKRPNWTSR